MTFLIKYARPLKWICLVLAILAFAVRLISGQLYEEATVNEITGHTRMAGSSFGIWMVVVGVIMMLGFAAFSLLSKPKSPNP